MFASTEFIQNRNVVETLQYISQSVSCKKIDQTQHILKLNAIFLKIFIVIVVA